jgi:hypothetical protein
MSLKGLLTDEHLDNALPSSEALDEDVRGLELIGSGVLPDLKGLVNK